jgi:translation elongation factor EF-Tu-like GTPase
MKKYEEMNKNSYTRKKGHQKAVRITISMPPVIWEAGSTRQEELGFPGLSDYIQDLIRSDAGLRKAAQIAQAA